MPMQIVDKPSARRMSIHPAKEFHNFVIGQMMGEQRAYDEIGAVLRIK
jgi:hypothetical protein